MHLTHVVDVRKGVIVCVGCEYAEQECEGDGNHSVGDGESMAAMSAGN